MKVIFEELEKELCRTCPYMKVEQILKAGVGITIRCENYEACSRIQKAMEPKLPLDPLQDYPERRLRI